MCEMIFKFATQSKSDLSRYRKNKNKIKHQNSVRISKKKNITTHWMCKSILHFTVKYLN